MPLYPSKRCKSYTVRQNLDTSNPDNPYSNSYYESDDGRCILTPSSSMVLGDLAKNELPLDANCGQDDVSNYATYQSDYGTMESSPQVGLKYEYTDSNDHDQYATGKITEKTEEEDEYNIINSETREIVNNISSSRIRHNIYPICGNDL